MTSAQMVTIVYLWIFGVDNGGITCLKKSKTFKDQRFTRNKLNINNQILPGIHALS